MRNILLRLEFVGTNYAGWQRQKEDRSVQEVMEEAILGVTGEASKITGCSRTDAGVHAEDFVANFKTRASIPAAKFAKAIQSRLPRDIYVSRSREVSLSFNSRRHSYSKTYRYQIFRGFSPFNTTRWWQIEEPLDNDLLSRSAEVIAGRHDFSSFCVTKSLKRDNRCEILQAAWSIRGRKLYFKITGDRYLHRMIRFLVGAQVEVAVGKIPLEEISMMLKSAGKIKCRYSAPPEGLYLMKVRFTERTEE